MKREEETTHPCYKPVRKTKKHIAEEAKRFSFLYPSESKEMFFIYGAEWAEETMLNRACEWLAKHISPEEIYESETNETSTTYLTVNIHTNMYDFIKDFRKAMEGGAE